MCSGSGLPDCEFLMMMMMMMMAKMMIEK